MNGRAISGEAAGCNRRGARAACKFVRTPSTDSGVQCDQRRLPAGRSSELDTSQGTWRGTAWRSDNHTWLPHPSILGSALQFHPCSGNSSCTSASRTGHGWAPGAAAFRNGTSRHTGGTDVQRSALSSASPLILPLATSQQQPHNRCYVNVGQARLSSMSTGPFCRRARQRREARQPDVTPTTAPGRRSSLRL